MTGARGSSLEAGGEATSRMRLGIFGGTFNPIHWGHLVLAETARETLGLDRVLFVPAHQPPHKRGAELAPGLQRLAMVRLAVRDHPAFAASDLELMRQGVSYTLDTVQTIHDQLPEATLFLLMGQDMLRVPWRNWAAMKRLCTIVVAPRAKPARAQAKMRWLGMPRIDVASSDIRARVAAGRSIRYLVPPPVQRYIRQHHLYEHRRGG